MGELFSVWRFALRRFAANWPLMLLVGAGALLATTLLAAAPIYTDTMSDIGLRFRLERELDKPRERAISLNADRLRLGDPVQLAQTRAFAEITEARVGWMGPELLVEQRSDPLQVSFVSAADGSERRPWPGRLVHLSGYQDHVEVVEGRLPSAQAVTAEVVLPDGFQREAAVGDRVLLTARRYDDCRRVPPSEDEEVAADEVICRPSTFVSASLTAEIVGFVRPNDPDDLRWQFFEDGWAVPDEPPRGRSLFGPSGGMPLLTSGAYYSGALTTQLPELLSRYRAGVVPDLQGLAVRDVPRALDDLAIWPARSAGRPRPVHGWTPRVRERRSPSSATPVPSRRSRYCCCCCRSPAWSRSTSWCSRRSPASGRRRRSRSTAAAAPAPRNCSA